LSYIPESAWNESGSVTGGSELWSGGGGVSQVYGKPSWQTGPGVPSDGQRDVPDVALTAAVHDGYLVAMNNGFYIFGGTSAAAPSFAGLMAMVDQKMQARQGNANPVFYALAAKQSNGGAGVFHDVTSGNNSVPGQAGFTAGTGYDAATGLGSVDASILVNHWGDASTPTPSLHLTAPATPSVTPGKSTTATVTTSVSGGFSSVVTLSATGAPSGLTASLSPTALAAPGSGSSTLTLTAASYLAPGSYNLTLKASGGGITQTATLGVTVSPNCSYSLGGSSASAPATGGNFTDNVTTQSGCSWTAASNVSWISLTGGATGTGSGTVGYTVASNNTLASRSGTVTIAGKTLSVVQAAATAVFSLTSSSASFSATGGNGSVSLTAKPTNATWKAVSNASWITITAGNSGAGSGTVSYRVASNTSAARTGTMTIAGQTFTVSQSGTAASANCSYQVSVGAISAATNGYLGSVSVKTASGCPWTASSSAPWLTVTSGASGAGNGTVSFLAGFNTTGSQRAGILSVAGYGISITEAPGH